MSYGTNDKTLIEFKLASNKKLKMNLANQTAIYETANNVSRSIKVILYFDDTELARVEDILEELDLSDDQNIVLIDATNNKPSASNVQ